MSEYVVQASVLSSSIFVGRLSAKGDAFADKQERTDMTLAAVAQYVERNFAGGLEVDFPGLGVVMNVQVRPVGTSPAEPVDAPSVEEVSHGADVAPSAGEPDAWVDKHGDVWRLDPDTGLMKTRETTPFPREYVERKWGPLRPMREVTP